MRTLFWSNSETIECVEKKLHGGGVVLAEGDTVLGLLADVSQKGRAQLDHIKNRSKKPYLILVGGSKKALSFIETDSYKPLQIEKLMQICWPGPVTLIFRAKAGVTLCSQSADGTIALRVPDHAGLLQLLSQFDGLFSTSANNAGAPVPSAIKEVDSAIISAVACVVMNDDSEKAQSHLPSTIIDCTGEGLVVVRQGAFDASRLMD
jgi:tRNA threonylcarbamoyl adenosine modification protein (Sua5/YciO/YrdC/YwlC family)